MNFERLLSARASAVQESLIRRVFEEGRSVPDPIDLTMGQPDFPVPEPIKAAAARAIQENRNGYSSNRGIDPLLEKIAAHLKADVGWDVWAGPTLSPASLRENNPHLMVTMGTSGGLILAAMALLDPGDEIIIPEPYFVLYPRLGELTGAKTVRCETYPDFRMTAARVEPLITARTKAVLLNSPSNPCGVVLTEAECRDLLDLCRRRGVLLISDEIYDEFTYTESRVPRVPRRSATDSEPSAAERRATQTCCPSPCRFPGAQECTLLIRGFGKTYGPTGWRLGYAAGPPSLIPAMLKLQMHFYINAPTPLQHGAAEAFGVDMSVTIADYQRRRDLVLDRLSIAEIPRPGGAFYAFVKVPERLGMTATELKDAAKARRVLVVPGAAFSSRDTHFRISYATREDKLREGLEILADLMR